MTQIIIREFQFPEDYHAVFDLWDHAGNGIQLRRSDEPDEIQKKLLRDPDLFLVAEENGRIIGAVMGGFDGRRGMMYHLAVDETCRHQGVGSLLMENLESRLREKGCIRYYLMVLKGNQDSIHFYETHGCEPMDLIIFGKDIG